jgi:quercetin dioxygenase-like cupin family protein
MRIIDTNSSSSIEPEGHFGGLTTVDVIGPENAQYVTVQVSRGPVGSGAYLHLHEEAEQLFFVFKGELTMTTEAGDSVVLRPGMAAYFAPGEAHATKNNGTEEVLSLVITSPQI